ncbi:potassium-transporting ATPase subunit KdpC [bacterium]|nr:potassium-transporting ATPase subunit KdpC [bacterium]
MVSRQFAPALRLTLVTFVLCGILYPLITTGLAQLLFPRQANGSLITVDGAVAGSELIGQRFEGPQWFKGRVSSIGYKAEASGASNLGPTSKTLYERLKADISSVRRENPDVAALPVPVDLLTQSGSGLDPHITPAAARFQAPRVAAARQLSLSEVEALIVKSTENRALGLFGEPRVNVLMLNLALAGKG